MEADEQGGNKARPVGYLSYLGYAEKGYGCRVGPVFGTKREDCKSVVVEAIPVRLVQDMQLGELGSFFIWDAAEKSESK